MRVLIDTNVLISAALNADGVPYQAFVRSSYVLQLSTHGVTEADGGKKKFILTNGELAAALLSLPERNRVPNSHDFAAPAKENDQVLPPGD